MTRPLILLVGTEPDRRTVQARLQQSGRWWVLPAAGHEHAVRLWQKVRPAVIVVEAMASSGLAARLQQDVRTYPLYTRIPLVVVGTLTVDEQRVIGADPHAVALGTAGESALADVLQRLLDEPA